MTQKARRRLPVNLATRRPDADLDVLRSQWLVPPVTSQCFGDIKYPGRFKPGVLKVSLRTNKSPGNQTFRRQNSSHNKCVYFSLRYMNAKHLLSQDLEDTAVTANPCNHGALTLLSKLARKRSLWATSNDLASRSSCPGARPTRPDEKSIMRLMTAIVCSGMLFVSVLSPHDRNQDSQMNRCSSAVNDQCGFCVCISASRTKRR